MTELKLFTSGVVNVGERKFTKLVGGFGEGKNVLTTKQIAELMDYDNSIVNRTIKRNLESFEENVDIIDLKVAVPEWHSEIGYTQNAYNASKNVYILSESGFLLYLKLAEGEKSVELYKLFIEDYFHTKAENVHMKKSIKETLESLQEERALLIGKTVIARNESERLEAVQMLENKNKQIIELEKALSEEELVKKLESKIHLADTIENSSRDFDIGLFTKILNLQGMGRNKLFEWLREKKILMKDNTPYQNYVKYFSVIPVVHGNFTNNKTLIRPSGIDFVIKRLIKDGKVITKPVSDILKELEVAN